MGDDTAMSAFQTIGKDEPAPIGFLDMCTRSPVDCAHWPDSDLPGIVRRSIDKKRDMYRKVFSRPATPAAHAEVLSFDGPAYLAYDWVPASIRQASQTVYTWPEPAVVTAVRDDLARVADQFAFGPVDVVFIPAEVRAVVRAQQRTMSGVFTSWPDQLNLQSPQGLPDLSGLIGDAPSPFSVSLVLPPVTSFDAFRQEVSFRLSGGDGDGDLAAARSEAADWRDSEPAPPPAPAPIEAPPASAPEPVSAPLYPEVRLTPSQYAILRRINGFVNRAIIPETDMDQYQVDDYWVAPGVQPGARGDCEDYALEKRRELIMQGFPAAAMSLAIVSLPFEKTHAVLIVTTTDADFVLDNLSPMLRVWRDTHYPWLIRQGPKDDLDWFSVAGDRWAPPVSQ